ncbi:hypothetical protein MENTO_v1c05140 [Mesoplasma entomophilum]|uniref:Uncharacterized protein n=1 Tax=Mesoplasma entomophilum TaxID=2149 RepID=A0A3S5Y0C5_9MOLU|nr:hypothetical protein [Mesoplasma entomophilum]ATQ35649.1 hypothetical protein CS528_02655 [Mesoplasma entomophilum]ATZ19618.1 hypothetical protein MENTO_v1c05140 [Mesoplasma entomophilum]
MKNKIKLTLLLFIAITPIFCVGIDLLMSVIQPDSESGGALTFDQSIINQVIYFSVWTTLITSFWGIAAVLNYFRKNSKRIAWAESDNVMTMVVSYQIVVFLIYTFTFIASRDGIVGFNTWYKVLKSVLEHWILPFVVIGYYILRERESTLTSKEFMKKKAWINCIIPFAYIFFISIRGLMIVKYSDKADWFTPFPYSQLDPTDQPVYLWLPGMISFIALFYFVSSLVNFTSIKLNNKISIKYKFVR